MANAGLMLAHRLDYDVDPINNLCIIMSRACLDVDNVDGPSGAVFSYKLRYIVGFWLVEMAISTNQKPTIYRNLYENTGPVLLLRTTKFITEDKKADYILLCGIIPVRRKAISGVMSSLW